jgi:hypothetical protein
VLPTPAAAFIAQRDRERSDTSLPFLLSQHVLGCRRQSAVGPSS